ncbi:DUF2490 domain-containing protein [uncultured Winogradskyella sp.]|uniref:DUF2490 domain-containing protein n=1 Tax=Winogradskyella sp. 4-2091 TaxID=3381659 RepID=UPI00260D3FBA|nr:DUF2490 domain-containing protein [uncultured Winogradskyella sp.]
MYSIKKVLLLHIILLGLNLNSQNDFEGLGETAFSINHKVNSTYKTNFAIKSRYYLYQDESFSFINRQIDLVHFSTLALDYNHSLSLGIQYRIRESIDEGSDELRLVQQFNYTKKKNAIRFGHRFRTEQRFLKDLTILRTRYRFAIDFPLNGEKLDIGEPYLVASMEGLLSTSSKLKPELDHRATYQMGWLLSKKSKFQFGFEYRFEALNINTEHKLFILTSYILKV